MKRNIVYVLVLGGEESRAIDFAQRRYSSSEIVMLSKREWRESGWKGQLVRFRQLEGKALLVFTKRLESLHDPLLLKFTTLLHRCRETVLADETGRLENIRRSNLLPLMPIIILSGLADLTLFASAWLGLRLFRLWLKLFPKPMMPADAPVDVAFLYPSAINDAVANGALTHITGFLSGLKQGRMLCAVFSGRRLQSSYPEYEIVNQRRFYLFRESVLLSYNFAFFATVCKAVGKKGARVLYQRHGKFTIAGALLSQVMRVPLVLEYNSSESWRAKFCDPSRFVSWLRICERVSLEAASSIVVVSDLLKQELVAAKIPGTRILVNPNGVDTTRFHPQCGGAELRDRFGFERDDVVVGFAGTFSYWHGIGVLQKAIELLLSRRACSPYSKLRFLLIGDGLFAAQLRRDLDRYVRSNVVLFTGVVPHESVRGYLDAADILVSPTVHMPDGTRFFGSPTKLFEYMAMAKAIIASDVEQLAQVLHHGETGLLVPEGDSTALAEAIEVLASSPEDRNRLGCNARSTAMAHHTWEQNAARVLEHCGVAARNISSPASLAVPRGAERSPAA